MGHGESEKGNEYVKRLCAVADTCARFGISYFTLHCMNVPEFNVDVTSPLKCSQAGLDRFERVVEYAAERGVKACFENVEFPQFELCGRCLIRFVKKLSFSRLDVGCGA